MVDNTKEVPLTMHLQRTRPNPVKNQAPGGKTAYAEDLQPTIKNCLPNDSALAGNAKSNATILTDKFFFSGSKKQSSFFMHNTLDHSPVLLYPYCLPIASSSTSSNNSAQLTIWIARQK